MKTSLYFFFIMFMTIFASAQNYFLTPSDSLSGTLDVSGDWIKTIPLKIEIVNLTASNLKLKWKTINKELLPEWSYSICDHVQCYSGAVPDSATLNQIAPYDTGFLKVTVYDSITPGDGHVKLLLYSSAPEVDTLSYYFSFIVPVPEITAKGNFSVTSSISSGVLKIIISGAKNARFYGTIYNVIGQPVKYLRLSCGLTLAGIADLDNGIYFLNITGDDGRTFVVRFVR